jgi:transposase
MGHNSTCRERGRVCAEYKRGLASIRQLAEKYKRNKSTIQAWLGGKSPTQPVRKRTGRPRTLTREQVDTMMELMGGTIGTDARIDD